MVQIIQLKRKFTGPGTPATLAPGELAFNSTGNKLVIGGTANTILPLVGSERQVEMTGDQPNIQGAKAFATGAGNSVTISVPNLKVPGGNPGEALVAVDAAGNMGYAPIANPIQRFIGSFKGSDGSVLLTADAGGGTALPAAATSDGAYLICDEAGGTNPVGAPAGQYEKGDWLISNGVAWTHLFFGGVSAVMASDVGVVAPVTGGITVQEVLESLEAADATFVVGPASVAADANIAVYDLLTGKLIKDSLTKVTDLVTNAAFTASQATQDGVIALKGDVSSTGTMTAQHVAVFTDVAGKTIIDGGVLVTDLLTTADLVGLGDVVGPNTVASADLIAAFDGTTGKLIKSGAILTTDLVVQADIATMGDVKGQAAPIAATGNIAIYNGVDPKSIIDGGVALAGLATDAELTAAQTLDVKIAGSTMTGPLILSEHPVSGTSPPLQAATIQAIDDAIATIPAAAGAFVTAPELTGDGLALATAITFTGITTDAVIGPGAFAATFSGNGLSTGTAPAGPLTLVCVDGGEYI